MELAIQALGGKKPDQPGFFHFDVWRDGRDRWMIGGHIVLMELNSIQWNLFSIYAGEFYTCRVLLAILHGSICGASSKVARTGSVKMKQQSARTHRNRNSSAMPRSPKEKVPAAGESLLARTLQVMRRIATDSRPTTLQDLSRELHVSLATTHRILANLEAQGWVTWDRDRCIMEVGPAMMGLSAAISARYGAEGAIRPILKALVDECGETVCLHMLDLHARQLYAYVVEESTLPLSYRITPGEMTYLHTGASGRAAMAFLRTEVFDDVINFHGLPTLTARTITKLTTLRRELQAVRKQGYAYSESERVEGAVGIAAPVLSQDGDVFGSLIITVPQFRYVPAAKDRLAKLAIGYAPKVAALLAGAGSYGDRVKQ